MYKLLAVITAIVSIASVQAVDEKYKVSDLHDPINNIYYFHRPSMNPSWVVPKKAKPVPLSEMSKRKQAPMPISFEEISLGATAVLRDIAKVRGNMNLPNTAVLHDIAAARGGMLGSKEEEPRPIFRKTSDEKAEQESEAQVRADIEGIRNGSITDQSKIRIIGFCAQLYGLAQEYRDALVSVSQESEESM